MKQPIEIYQTLTGQSIWMGTIFRVIRNNVCHYRGQRYKVTGQHNNHIDIGKPLNL